MSSHFITAMGRQAGQLVAAGAVPISVLHRAKAQGEEHIHRAAIHWVKLLFALGVVTMLASWWLAPWGVKLLFERGAFTAQSTVVVAKVLRYGLTQLPFYFAGIVLVSLLSSQGKYRAIAVIAGTNLFVKWAAMTVLTPALGINGIVISTSIMYASSLLLLGKR